MGTSNFYNNNATSIFSLEIEDQWHWDMVFEDLTIQLAESYDYMSYRQPNAPTPSSDNRSLGGLVLGEKKKHTYDDERGVELIVVIRSIIRSGYYSGANLDWEIEVEKIHYDPLTDEDELWLQNAREDLINELEGFYKEVSTPLGVTARASNGTCMYHKK